MKSLYLYLCFSLLPPFPFSEGQDSFRPKLIGRWACGPTQMVGSRIEVNTFYNVLYSDDGTYSSEVRTRVVLDNGKSVNIRSREEGSWALEGDVIVTKVESVRVKSTDRPYYPLEVAQMHAEEQLRKKDLWKSRILEINNEMNIVPVDPLYREADVKTRCERS